MFKEFADPYTFPSYHKRILEPYNYYEFGQRYVASLTDFSRSLLGHPERWNRIASLLEKGENVVLLANHQTEADPGGLGVTDALSTVSAEHVTSTAFAGSDSGYDMVIPQSITVTGEHDSGLGKGCPLATCMFILTQCGRTHSHLSNCANPISSSTPLHPPATHFLPWACLPDCSHLPPSLLPGVFALMLQDLQPKLATDVVYVAGDRVVTDALCKPFSMGRNLFCVHSKKHLDDVPGE